MEKELHEISFLLRFELLHFLDELTKNHYDSLIINKLKTISNIKNNPSTIVITRANIHNRELINNIKTGKLEQIIIMVKEILFGILPKDKYISYDKNCLEEEYNKFLIKENEYLKKEIIKSLEKNIENNKLKEIIKLF